MHWHILLGSLFFLAMTLVTSKAAAGASIYVWIGTETGGNSESEGIYHAQLDLESGQLTNPTLAAKVASPGFLTLHPTLPVLYATATNNRQPGVAAFRFENKSSSATPELTQTSFVATGGGGGTCVATSKSGKTLFSAQYGGGTVASYQLNDDGTIAQRVSLIKHQGGSGVVKGRQDAPHPHWIGTSPDDRFVFVPDLGLDQVVIYRLDDETGEISAHGKVDTPPGGGPRHMKFSADAKFAYVLNELELSVSVFAYDAQAGSMTLVETVPTVSSDAKAKERFVSAAEIRIHPSGKFVYASNRGHDTITAFARDESTGCLAKIECEPIRGSFPRNFNIDPSGRWLVAAGQVSNTLSVFEIDAATGELAFAQNVVNAPRPICVVFGY